ncbi:MAG: hypothetical protein SFW36_08910 [Leptolyngbyaceae cyanobacterium bins.59]|nr:hypothetical protein [Leptolyngbyaceae cyanobacterium bins.59]
MPWIRPAVIEALYQGRYKAISVTQLLTFWQRREQPLCHFSHEFERIICSALPKTAFNPTPGLCPPSEPIAEIHLSEPVSNHQTSEEVPAISHPPTPAVGPSLEAQTAQLERLRALIERFASGKHPSSASAPETPLPFRQTWNREDVQLQDNVVEENGPTAYSEAHVLDTQEPASRQSLESINAPDFLEDATSLPPLDPPPFAEAPPPVVEQYSEPQAYTSDFWLSPESEPPANHPIHQFIPASSPGEGYDKLRSVIRGMG